LNTYLNSPAHKITEGNVATFAYGRVSTKEQSTENQRLEIQQAGYQVDYWFADEGVSGKVMAQQRPQFARLLGQIRDGETLVVSKLDRLGRDAHDVGSTIKLLASRGIKVIVLQLGALDLASPAGKMMLTMLAAVAELERDLLIERTQAGLQRAKQQGKVLGRPATTTAEQRTDILARHKAGASISELSRLHGVSRATIMRIAKPESVQI
jgi:putative DNA-invertase from lambdoid prophage Rac